MPILPVSEMFLSPQGEGLWTGTYMHFVRLAGCSVGRPFTEEEREAIPGLQVYQEKCTAWDGSHFACDTNYKMSSRESVEEIYKWGIEKNPRVNHVVITGGEPLVHDLEKFFVFFLGRGFVVHLETSGTKEFPAWLKMLKNGAKTRDKIWITVSPKAGYLMDNFRYVSEIKVLVSRETFDKEKFRAFHTAFLKSYGTTLGAPLFWVQPINEENSIRKENVDLCLELMDEYPDMRLSLQMHKLIGVR